MVRPHATAAGNHQDWKSSVPETGITVFFKDEGAQGTPAAVAYISVQVVHAGAASVSPDQ